MPKPDSLLQPGDVIELSAGHSIYADVPKHFVIANRIGNYEPTHHAITIGEPLKGFDTAVFAGRYVVIRTASEGGGTGHGPGDVFPNGHHVFCQGLRNEARVDFYQTGCFTAMIPDIHPCGRAECSWREVEHR